MIRVGLVLIELSSSYVSAIFFAVSDTRYTRLRLQPDLQRSAHYSLIEEVKRVSPCQRYYSVVVPHPSVAADLYNVNVICGPRGINNYEIRHSENSWQYDS